MLLHGWWRLLGAIHNVMLGFIDGAQLGGAHAQTFLGGGVVIEAGVGKTLAVNTLFEQEKLGDGIAADVEAAVEDDVIVKTGGHVITQLAFNREEIHIGAVNPWNGGGGFKADHLDNGAGIRLAGFAGREVEHQVLENGLNAAVVVGIGPGDERAGKGGADLLNRLRELPGLDGGTFDEGFAGTLRGTALKIAHKCAVEEQLWLGVGGIEVFVKTHVLEMLLEAALIGVLVRFGERVANIAPPTKLVVEFNEIGMDDVAVDVELAGVGGGGDGRITVAQLRA